MTTTTMPCPSQVPCPGTVTVTVSDHGSAMSCDTCVFQMVRSNRGQLDIGVTRDPMLDARNDIPVLFEDWTYASAKAAMRRMAMQEIYAMERWADAWDIGVQAIHIIATHELDGYGLASSPRRAPT